MFTTRFLISMAELALMIFSSGLLIVLIYRIFIRANPDFDMEKAIKEGNVAVGILMASIMVCAALMLARGLSASVAVFRLAMSTPLEGGTALWQAVLLIGGHLLLSLAIAVLTISVTLRLFGRLSRRLNPEMHMGKQLERGNIAVGILLSAVVFIASMYVGDGVSAVTKALVPQPEIGTIRIME
jgi:uncharacterized membrane protein YjfL (UPF0719 family)